MASPTAAAAAAAAAASLLSLNGPFTTMRQPQKPLDYFVVLLPLLLAAPKAFAHNIKKNVT